MFLENSKEYIVPSFEDDLNYGTAIHEQTTTRSKPLRNANNRRTNPINLEPSIENSSSFIRMPLKEYCAGNKNLRGNLAANFRGIGHIQLFSVEAYSQMVEQAKIDRKEMIDLDVVVKNKIGNRYVR